jgi:hypothetical protein
MHISCTRAARKRTSEPLPYTFFLTSSHPSWTQYHGLPDGNNNANLCSSCRLLVRGAVVLIRRSGCPEAELNVQVVLIPTFPCAPSVGTQYGNPHTCRLQWSNGGRAVDSGVLGMVGLTECNVLNLDTDGSRLWIDDVMICFAVSDLESSMPKSIAIASVEFVGIGFGICLCTGICTGIAIVYPASDTQQPRLKKRARDLVTSPKLVVRTKANTK